MSHIPDTVRGIEGFCPTASYTLTSQTAAQPLFDPAVASKFTSHANTTYRFEFLIRLTSMSGTNGNAQIDLLGAGNSAPFTASTATITSINWAVDGVDSTNFNSANALNGGNYAAVTSAANIFTSGVGTGMWARGHGIMRVNAGGTVIPSILLTTAATPVVAKDSYFFFQALGSSAITGIGPLS